MFFISFTKRNNIIHVSFSEGCSFLNGVHFSRKELVPKVKNSFLEEVTLLRREAKKGKLVDFFLYESVLLYCCCFTSTVNI